MELSDTILPPITSVELDNWRRLIQQVCGNILGDSKAYLLQSRLSPLCKETGSKSFGELYFKVRNDAGGPLTLRVIDAITTKETFFFRDELPFICLKEKVVPDLVQRHRLKLSPEIPIQIRVWSAGCSTGQEAYSIIMAIHESLNGRQPYKLRTLGTDISEEAVSRAAKGLYSSHEMSRGLPPELSNRYFRAVEDKFQISEEFRTQARFQTLDLLKPFPILESFDIIFCRNVAIYFSEADRENLFFRLSSLLAPDGVLFIGATETIRGYQTRLTEVKFQKGVYFQKSAGENPRPVNGLFQEL